MSCGAKEEANELIDDLTEGMSFVIPNPDLTGPEFQLPDGASIGLPVSRLTNDDLTTRTVDGTGTFDALMAGFNAHLKEQFEKGRITGADYTKAYIALTEGAMSNATSYLLGRDQAYWQAITAQQTALLTQINVVTARVQMETAKVQLAAIQIQALTVEADYALKKMQLATASMDYCVSKYNLENMLPAQLAMVNSQKTGQDTQNSILSYNLTQTLPAQLGMIQSQKTGQDTQNQTASFNLANILPKQLLLVQEQMESQRAQTTDIRQSDGQPVTGVLGKQKDLYTQQITSYQRDAEVKMTKLFTDAWITMKTIDEGLVPPIAYQNSNLDTILASIQIKNGLNG